MTYLCGIIRLISHYYHNLALKISQSRGGCGLNKCTVLEERLVKRNVDTSIYLTTMKSDGRGG